MRAWAIAALAAAVAVVAGVVVSSHHGGGSSAAQGTFVTVRRGEVAVTVGGIGHVNTLTGAAGLAVPVSSGAGGGAGAAPTGATGGGSSSGAAASSSGSAAQAPADAVFAPVVGHVRRLLVRAGDEVVAGQAIATLADDGTMASNLLQARSDLSTARLELAQKRVQDPTRGVSPTGAELAAGRQSVRAARDKLAQLVGPPLPADVATARSDLAKVLADLQSARAGRSDAVAAAELAVTTARQRLALLTGAPDPAEVAAAQLELAKATLDQETLVRPGPPPSAAAVGAADAAVAAAQQRLSDAEASGTPADVGTARADLAKAQSERDALLAPAPAPTDAARGAAQLAVDAAQRKLDQVIHPPVVTVSAARGELAKAQADVAAVRASRSQSGLTAARAAVTAARRKLAQLLGPPTPDLVSAARLDVRKASADLAVLRQRGARASATDLALARLKVDVGAQRVALADQQARRLTAVANASGTVTSVLTVDGAAVDPATPLVRVQDLAHLVVTLDLSEFDVGRTRVGAVARISVDALGGREFGGRVVDVALGGAETGGVVNFPVIVALNSRGRLRPGMSVSARIVVTSHPDVVRIPLDAVVDQGPRTTVTVKAPTGAAARRPVELGIAGTQFVEVRSGLRAGERVLVPSGGA
jgi:RND family efflux transporter MFP subunit